MSLLDEGAARLTSSLNEARNDTGRAAFCGPIVLSAITGYSVSRVEEEIRAARDVAPARKPIVRGTDAEEVAAALAHFGYRMELTESYLRFPRKERPSLWSWMQKPRNAWIHYILAIHKGKDGHWVLIKGVKLCDTYSEGAAGNACATARTRARASWRCSRCAGHWGCRDGAPSSALELWVEPIAQTVAEQIEGKD